MSTHTWVDPTADLRMSTGTPVPTVCRMIAALAAIAAERQLTPAEVERLYAAAGSCGDMEVELLGGTR